MKRSGLVPTQPERFTLSTQECEQAGQDRGGCHSDMARLVPAAVALVSIAITATDGDGQRVGATEGRMSAVRDHHGNQVDGSVPQPQTGLQRQN